VALEGENVVTWNATPTALLAALLLLGGRGGGAAQAGTGPAHVGVAALYQEKTPPRESREKKAEDYLLAARLERECGNLKAALEWCFRIKKEFPENRKVTPKALLMGAEILLELNRIMRARGWTTDAIKRFRDLPDYQKRIAILHRYSITRLTYAIRNHPRYHVTQYCLILQWSVRGLSAAEIRKRYDRFWKELNRHFKDWERPGKEKGKEKYPPSGMGRVMEWLSAALARDVLEAHGKHVESLDELVGLLRERIQALRGLWASPVPDPRALERFDRLMCRLDETYKKFRKATRSMVTFHIPRKPGRKKEKPLSSLSRKELEAKVRSLRSRVRDLEKEIRELKRKVEGRRKDEKR